MIQIPPLLRQGDKIGIVSPARKIDSSDLAVAAEILGSWGFGVRFGQNIFSTKHSYLSGTDPERLSDLQVMLDDPSIRALICARGGYGSTRIVDQLNFDALKKNPKWVVGFSDITALHLQLFKNGLASIHGTMPILFSKPDSARSVESLKNILVSGRCNIEMLSNPNNRIGKTNGAVVGGNLSLIADSLGTATEIDTTEKILVIEEIDEYLYKIDRTMIQLRRAGKLKNLAGLIVGHMTDIKDTQLSFGERVEEIILNSVSDYSFPVAFDFPSGHENPNLSWFHGAPAAFSVDEDGSSLSYELFHNKYSAKA
jgi:muramoyltetrapeptide carboxypeptidase